MSQRVYAATNEASRVHGELIRKTRLGLGMTQRELAKIFGVWRETINRIENGHFDITRAYPKYKLLNERMRIWAEMNKGGRKRTYRNSKRRCRISQPGLIPHISPWTRYWKLTYQTKKEKHGEDVK